MIKHSTDGLLFFGDGRDMPVVAYDSPMDDIDGFRTAEAQARADAVSGSINCRSA